MKQSRFYSLVVMTSVFGTGSLGSIPSRTFFFCLGSIPVNLFLLPYLIGFFKGLSHFIETTKRFKASLSPLSPALSNNSDNNILFLEPLNSTFHPIFPPSAEQSNKPWYPYFLRACSREETAGGINCLA
jgi:hypothetical protein